MTSQTSTSLAPVAPTRYSAVDTAIVASRAANRAGRVARDCSARSARYSHAVNRDAVVQDLAPIMCGLLRQARGAGNTDASVLDRLQADEGLRRQLSRAIGRKHVFSAETATDAWYAAREIAAGREVQS